MQIDSIISWLGASYRNLFAVGELGYALYIFGIAAYNSIN